MQRPLTLPLALVLLGLSAAPGAAQDSYPARATYDGAFARSYPEAARLLDAFDASRVLVFGQLTTAGGAAGLEGETYPALVSTLETSRGASAGKAFEGLDPHVQEILTRARVLQRQILDIHADAGVTDKGAAVDRVVDGYLSRPGVALSAQPKSILVMDVVPAAEGAAGGHAGHAMPADHGAHAGHDMSAMAAMDQPFWLAYPRVAGALRAQQWLENALYEPLLAYRGAAERKAGVDEAVRRFHAMFADAPESFPFEMPSTAAIAPELSTHHVRASVILNHLHMLEEAIVEILASPRVADRAAAISKTAASFTDPTSLAITDFQWLLQSLRPGIFSQGGPAIGTMERSDRNQRDHAGHQVMPGMPGRM